MGDGFVQVFSSEEGSAVMILRWNCPSGDAPAEFSGVGLDVAAFFSAWWNCLAH